MMSLSGAAGGFAASAGRLPISISLLSFGAAAEALEERWMGAVVVEEEAAEALLGRVGLPMYVPALRSGGGETKTTAVGLVAGAGALSGGGNRREVEDGRESRAGRWRFGVGVDADVDVGVERERRLRLPADRASGRVCRACRSS